jgi:two-component SAPR family response regulator
MLTTGKFLSLQEWLSVLPPEVINTSPAFLSLRGAILVNSGEISQGIILFSQVIDRLQNTDRFNVVLIITMIRRAVSYRMIGNYKKSLLDSFQALEILEQEPLLGKLRAETLRNIGLNHYYNGDFKEALNVLKQSLNIFESYKDEENIPRVLFNIALLDKVLGDYDLAERMYLKALKYWQSGSNFAWLADLLNNLGIIQQLRGDYINAAANFEKAIEYSRIISSPRSEAISLTSLGDLYRDMDAFDEAQQVYQHALGIAKQLNDRFLLFYLDLAEGNLNQIKGDLIKAKAFFDDASKKAIDSGSSLNDKMLMSELAMYWLKTGNGNKAYELASQSRFYFENEGHHIEAFRAAFTCVLSQILSGGRTEAIPDLELITMNIVENKYATPLVIQARNFLNILSSTVSQQDVETLITRIITRVDLYESNLLSIRKKVRQQASIVDFEPPRIIIQSFGKGQVILKNKLVTNSDWQTSTAKDMFFVFLAHEGGLTKDQVGLIFWPDASQEDVKLRFKNGLYRLRRAVGSQAIILDEDYYYFNRNLDYEYDADVFVTAIESANKITNPDQKIKLLETATKVYAGEYLPEIDGTWAIIPRRRYHLMHLEALMQLANIYFEKTDYKVALRYCFQALSEDACLEQAHRIAMRIHAIMGNRAEITRQYEHCCLALKDEVNASPSKQTNELYEMLIHK